MSDERARRARGRRPAPARAPAAASSPPTRWRWRFEVLGISPMGSASLAGPRTEQGRASPTRPGELRDGACSRRGSSPRDMITAPGARERDRRRRRVRRLDQRRAAPARGRARGRRRRSTSTTSTAIAARTPPLVRPQARRPLRRDRPLRRPAASPVVAKRLLEAGPAARGRR